MSWFDDLKTPRFKGNPPLSPAADGFPKPKPDLREKVAKIPEGLWGKCPSCGEIIQTKQLQENSSVCTECDHHLRISAVERIALLTDENSFVPYGEDFKSNDPLKFDDQKPYADRLKQAMKNCQMNDAFLSGKATLEGLPFHLGVFEFKFMGGSMGTAVGEGLVMAAELAVARKAPLIAACTSWAAASMLRSRLNWMEMLVMP